MMRVASKTLKPLALVWIALDSLKVVTRSPVDEVEAEEKLSFWVCAAILQIAVHLLPVISIVLAPFGGEIVLLVALYLGGSKLVLWVLSLARPRTHRD